MKWETHIDIAKTIAKLLSLSKNEEKALIEGSIEPDKHPDKIKRVVWRRGRRRAYTVNVSHHNPKLDEIMKHIWKAKRAYLKGDSLRAMRRLGRALHYIQDKSVAKGFFGLSHDSREDELSFQMVPEDMIKKGMDTAICSPHYVKKVINAIEPKKRLDEIMTQACISSATVVKAVIGDKTPSCELIENFEIAKKRYRKITIPLSIVLSVAIIVASIAIQSFLFFILGILAGYIAPRLDRRYHYLKEEAKWFGLV